MATSSVDISNAILPFDNFYNWIHSICVVTFDIELGQTMECIYPKHVKLTNTEKANINYSAFPDSNSGCMGDTIFHFHFRSSSILHNLEKITENYPDYIKPTSNSCFGYVNFRQVKNKEIRRGYFQKSVVILSVLPFTNFFYKLVEIISDAYFNDGEVGLEAVSLNIDKWPPPYAGPAVINLPVRGVVLQIHIPVKSDQINTEPCGRVKVSNSFIEDVEKDGFILDADYMCILPSAVNQDCFVALGSVINQLQLLWELVLTNQALLVIANSPVLCSMIVQALVNMIAPLKFSQDYRPFFTIHDSEFKEFTSKSKIPQVVLGITNPFFVKALSHWPNILKVTDVKLGMSKDKHTKQLNYLFKQDEIKPGMYSNFKSYLQFDKSLVKSIQKGLKNGRPTYAQSEIIRKFFLELTQSFMYPLERYVASLMPLRKEIVPFKGPPPLKRFNLDEFIKNLESNGPQLTSGIKGDWMGLYRQFYASSNFAAWLAQRQYEITLRLMQIHTDILCRADLSMWIVNKPEVELVDLIIQIHTKQKDHNRKRIKISYEQEQKLISHIGTIMSALPPDLQEMMQKSYSGTGAPRSL